MEKDINSVRAKISGLIVEYANSAKETVKPFVNNQVILSNQFPKGATAYLSKVVFDIKVEMNKDFILGAAWLRGGCQYIFTHHIISQIIDKLEEWYISEREQDKDFYEKGYLKCLKTEEELLEGLISYPIKPFFRDIRKIEALEAIIEHSPEITDNFTLMKINLTKYGFFALEKVKALSQPDDLLLLLSNKDTPYRMAMFEFLDYLLFLKKNYASNIIEKRNIILSEIVGTSKDTVKKQILSLNILANHSDEFKSRYTAHQYVEMVKNDYHNLK